MFTWFLQPWNIFNCEFSIFSDGGRKGYGYGPDGKDGYDAYDPNSRKASGYDPNDIAGDDPLRKRTYDNNRAGRKGSSDGLLGAGDANIRKGSGYDGNDPYGRKGSGYDPNDPNSRKGSRFDTNR